MADFDGLYYKIQDAIREAALEKEMLELAGEVEEYDDETGEMVPIKNPYDELIDVLKGGIRDAVAMKKHRHDWDEESGFCVYCGADGNA